MEYLVTYYVKNTNNVKDIFNVIPYASSVVTGSENEVLELIASKLKKNPFFCCCSVMDHSSGNKKVFETKYMLDNPHFKEDALQKEFKIEESVHYRDIDDSGKNVNEAASTEDFRKSFEVKLDHENKVIRIGAYFYDLKGVLICEATEEDKKKYHCNRFITFPIVDDDWRILEDEDITDGLERLIVGKIGDTVLLAALRDAIDYNAREHLCTYDDLLVSLERMGITVSNRKALDSTEELSDTVVIELSKIPGKHHFRLDSHEESYYIPRRFFHVGTDDELYQDAREGKQQTQNTYNKIVQQVADDVFSLSWFFHKPNLKVLVIAYVEDGDASHRYKIGPVPTDWFYTVQTLEGDINRMLDDMYKNAPDKYYKEKRHVS